MKVIDIINSAKSTLFSFEILPPLKGKSIQSIYDGIDPLIKFKPAFINVTYHREEYIYEKNKDGYLEKIAIKKRPGTVGICAAIKFKYNIETVPHLICGGFSKDDTENALIDLNFLGIDNILALRGDSIKTEDAFYPKPDGNAYALDLVKQTMELNKGLYRDKGIQEAAKTHFCIGVAGYPEKHFEAPNKDTDLRYLKEKIDAGADYIVTQMFFDNEKYFSFVDLCRKNGINVPIIPGLKPLATKNHLLFLPKHFSIEIPSKLCAQVEKCKDNDTDVRDVGIEWCIKQSEELKKFGVPSLHYYTMGRSYSVSKIAEAVF